MANHEDQQLNYPVKRYFERKLKCAVSRSEFRFIAGKLDVLAYDRGRKCFHICEGKRSSNAASVGHAIGQLIAYMSMIQEGGYNFLDTISKEERLELRDFASFLEHGAINVCFYVALPERNKDRLLRPAQLMLTNMGIFGQSIGIFFASKKKCELVTSAKPITIKIRKIYGNQDEFLEDFQEKFFTCAEAKGLVANPPNFPNLVQIKESGGNPYLHYEVWLRKARKVDTDQIIEVAFHLEFAKEHLKHPATIKRKKRLRRVLVSAFKELKKSGFDFHYDRTWGKQWSRLYTSYHANKGQLDDQVLDDVLTRLKKLITVSKPMFDRINWGRQKRIKEE